MKYQIPLFNLNYDDEEEKAVCETLRSKWISTGPKCVEFESLFSAALSVKYALTLDNCTNALYLSLILLGIEPGDEVLVPSLSFVATANCVRYANAVPIFCDICSLENPTIDPAEIRKNITPRTKAIIVMHYAGYPCNMDAIAGIAREYGLFLIEDACHAPLSQYNGSFLGTIGAIGCFSFFSNKNISVGEGGMLVTNNYDYYQKAKLLRSHGMTTMSFQRAIGHVTEYDVIQLGFNYRMDDIRASLGIVQLQKLPADLESRKLIREWYEYELAEIDDLIVPFKDRKDLSSNYIFPIVLGKKLHGKRDVIRELIASEGIQTSIHYPAIHRFAIYKEFASPLPMTELYSDNEFTLPMYAALKKENIVYITDKIKKILKNL